jgi:hypothetical protein
MMYLSVALNILIPHVNHLAPITLLFYLTSKGTTSCWLVYHIKLTHCSISHTCSKLEMDSMNNNWQMKKGLPTRECVVCSAESHCALRLRYIDLVVNIEVVDEVCCFVLLYMYSVVKQHLKCNTSDLQKVFVNKIIWVQASKDTRGHHFQHVL